MRGHVPLNLIAEWMDRESEPETGTLVERHLDSCESCRQLAAEMASVDEIFRATEKLELPPRIWARLEAQLHEEQPSRLAGSWFIPRLPALLRPIHVVALCAALLIGGAAYLIHHLAPDRDLEIAMAEMDRAHSALASLGDQFNPFSHSTVIDSRINPFIVRTLDIDHNPFQSALESR